MSEELRRGIRDGLRRSRKYATLCEDTLSRLADWAAARHTAPKAALKAAKRKLHQVYGAYLDQLYLVRVERLVEALPTDPTEDATRATCREVLACHASTAERLPIMAEVYPELLAAVPDPKAVIDLACGLHPFALPWMGLPPGARYRAYDIDQYRYAPETSFSSALQETDAVPCV